VFASTGEAFHTSGQETIDDGQAMLPARKLSTAVNAWTCTDKEARQSFGTCRVVGIRNLDEPARSC